MTATTPAARSDTLVIGLVGFSHLLSHFYQFALGPLFPLIHAEFGVSFTALGLVITLFYGVSGVCQLFVGILVDRYGADRLLLFGVSAMSGSVFLMGLVTDYWMLLPLAVVAAFGNCVFHPADLSILSTKVSPQRMGRAFAVHGFGGTCGYFLAPVVIFYGVASYAGWRVGLMVAGAIGWVAVMLLLRYRDVLRMPAGKEGDALPGFSFYGRLLGNRPLVAAFCYFALSAGALAAMQAFSAQSFVELYETPLALATLGLTFYLVGSAGGILVGGELADRVPRHALIATGGLVVAAASMACVALLSLPMPANIALFGMVGFAAGVTHPSRDILVRAATPAGATGKTFGFVYAGLDVGGSLAPIAFGWLMDGGQYRMVFVVIAVMYAASVLSVMQLTKGRAPAPAAAD